MKDLPEAVVTGSAQELQLYCQEFAAIVSWSATTKAIIRKQLRNPPRRTTRYGKQEAAKKKTKAATKNTKGSPAPLSDTPQENDKSTFRFAPKLLTVYSGAVFAVSRDDFDRMVAAGFNVDFNVPPALMLSPTSSPRSHDTMPTCKISKQVGGMSQKRFEEVEKLEPALRALQPDIKEFEACEPWIKKDGFCFVDDFLQKNCHNYTAAAARFNQLLLGGGVIPTRYGAVPEQGREGGDVVGAQPRLFRQFFFQHSELQERRW